MYMYIYNHKLCPLKYKENLSYMKLILKLQNMFKVNFKIQPIFVHF